MAFLMYKQAILSMAIVEIKSFNRLIKKNDGRMYI